MGKFGLRKTNVLKKTHRKSQLVVNAGFSFKGFRGIRAMFRITLSF